MNRLISIDILSGLVMLLMTLDPTRDMFSTNRTLYPILNYM